MIYASLFAPCVGGPSLKDSGNGGKLPEETAQPGVAAYLLHKTAAMAFMFRVLGKRTMWNSTANLSQFVGH